MTSDGQYIDYGHGERKVADSGPGRTEFGLEDEFSYEEARTGTGVGPRRQELRKWCIERAIDYSERRAVSKTDLVGLATKIEEFILREDQS